MKIYDLNDIPEELLPSVGGKARGLYRLSKMGLNVPQAFIVTDFSENDDFSDIVTKYEESGMRIVSVRSSATLEDGQDFSAAGQFATVLNVHGEQELRSAVKTCLDSLHSVTADNYSNAFLGGEKGKMTVVIQKMLDPRCAGVIFTKAPMRPGYSLVEVVPGLGENLVSGKMSAQQFRVRGNKIEDIPDYPLITNGEAIRMTADGLKIEEEFGMPMDLEWAIDKKNKLWWLQARPITVSESVTVNELDCPLDARDFVLTTGNVGEMMPGAVTPLNLSTNMYALDWGVKETYAIIGACTRDIPPYSFIASYYNHMFFNMTNMYMVCHAIFGSTKDTMDLAICGQVLEGFPDNPMKDLPILKRLMNTLPFMHLVFSGEEARTGMKKVIDALHFDLSADMNGIYAQILDNFDLLKKSQFYHYCASYYSGGQSNMLQMRVKSKFKDKEEMQALIAGCLTQIDEFESASILRCMIDLSKLILEDRPDAATLTAEQLQQYIETNASKAVKDSYAAFMERHGHRGIREAEIMSKPWRENPESFFASLKSVIGSAGCQRDEKPWTEFEKELLDHFIGRTNKNMIHKMILRARKGVCYREYTKSRIIYALDQFRKAYRRLAELMVEAGLLPDEECIFFLLQDEVGKLLAGDHSYVKKAMMRRRMFPIQHAMKFPYCQLGVPVPLPVEVAANKKAVRLHGTPVSRGIATGKARIVRTEEDAAKLEKGEIMVVESTDIGWTPYYNMVAGMVTEIGSALSHGIVVAREYALPAIVNVADAMHIIHDGDTITIDGNKGQVLIDRKK